MFEFFQVIAAKTGALFLGAALFLGVSIPAAEPKIVIDDSSAKQSTSEKASEASFNPVSANTPAMAPVTERQSTPSSANVTLRIEDVTVSVEGRDATIRWSTTVDARSSLTINGNTFDSEGVSKDHSVSLKDLRKGTRFSYEIVAKTLGTSASEDKVTRQFSTPPTYTVSIGLNSNKSCYVFSVASYVSDANSTWQGSGEPVWGYILKIGGENAVSTIPQRGFKTNSTGEVEYCEKVSSFIIEGKDIASVVAKSGVVVSNVFLKNLSNGREAEYGTYSAKFGLSVSAENPTYPFPIKY